MYLVRRHIGDTIQHPRLGRFDAYVFERDGDKVWVVAVEAAKTKTDTHIFPKT